MIDLSLVNMIFLSLTGSHGLPLSHWLPWSSSRSLAPMVFLSRWLPWSSSLSFAPMVFLSLICSHGLPLAHWLQWSSSHAGCNGLPLQWSSFHSGSNGLPIQWSSSPMVFISRWL